MAQFRLRFPERDIPSWAARYEYDDTEVQDTIAPAARARGHLTRDEFLSLCRWKTPRSQPRCASNPASFIEEATRVALASTHEEVKIGVLLLLRGVSWPTASVILHFCDGAKYPILDYRALWSLSVAQPAQYTFPFWWAYATFTRTLHQSTRYSMRTIDRALWQYSKERQRAGGA